MSWLQGIRGSSGLAFTDYWTAIPIKRSENAEYANVAKRIIMHGLAYSIEGLMTTMIAELACVISL